MAQATKPGAVSPDEIAEYAELIARLVRAAEASSRTKEQEAAGLAPHHAKAAMHIYNNEGGTVSGLAHALNVSLGWASRIADDLEREGLLDRRRDTEDRRMVRLTLAPKAADMARALLIQKDERINSALAPFSADDRMAARRVLSALAVAIGS